MKTASGRKKTTNFTLLTQKLLNYLTRYGDIGSSLSWKMTKSQSPSLKDLPELAPNPSQTKPIGQAAWVILIIIYFCRQRKIKY